MEFSSVVRSRVDFIKVCNLVANILDFPDDENRLNINILGEFKTKKAFVADVLVHAMDKNRSSYDIPLDNKMCFESIEGIAVKYPVAGFVDFKGKETLARFIRDIDHYRKSSAYRPEINIFSPFWRSTQKWVDAHVIIETGRCQETDLFLLRGEIVSNSLKTDKAREVLQQMACVNQRIRKSHLARSRPAF